MDEKEIALKIADGIDVLAHSVDIRAARIVDLAATLSTGLENWADNIRANVAAANVVPAEDLGDFVRDFINDWKNK